ncbi:hypothetical protein HPP92_010366 [Vanilla planifolia]|uniref:Uncharacterized protein n=1 Tax=Vanilla planifolia TaxID=51239 RepID=A0A835R3Z5_VANPL|nr:hypothetical protein HPP92_010366 [Vanilla planifolia]
MASNASSSASACKSEPSANLQISEVKEGRHASQDVHLVIDSLKKIVASERCVIIKRRIDENKQRLSSTTQHLYNLSKSRRIPAVESNATADLLTRRQNDALCMLNNLDVSAPEKDNNGYQEESSHTPTAVLFGHNYGGKNLTRPIKLAEMPKLPPYTTWIFLERNQRMADDQSVVGRRRIYYDPSCGEALICSDSEEEIVEEEDEKKEFGNIEDYILRMTIQELGLCDVVLESLSQCLEKSSSEIKARYENLSLEEGAPNSVKTVHKDGKCEETFLEKIWMLPLIPLITFSAEDVCGFVVSLVSQKNNFHGAAQTMGYLAASKSECNVTANSQMLHDLEETSNSSGSAETHPPQSWKKSCSLSVGRKVSTNQSEGASYTKVAAESSESEVQPRQENVTSNQSSPSKLKLGVKSGIRKRNSKRVAERVLVCIRKTQRQMLSSEVDFIVRGSIGQRDSKGSTSLSHEKASKKAMKKCKKRKSVFNQGFDSTCREVHSGSHGGGVKEKAAADHDKISQKEIVEENIFKNDCCYKSWSTIEKGLLSKGVEIFGRNSCLIARNLLNGLKTCMDIYHYLNFIENEGTYVAADGSHSLTEGNGKGVDMRARSRFLRRRGRVRRLKYTWKSAGYHSIRKRISERKDQPCRQYNPCGCSTACGKQCPCLLNGTCCEKYCGCPKICKNRFRGCHCAKSQCRSRQCPCFAADRECDPDVCRNCWVGCGDGSLGGPVQRGDNYECRNMKLLLKQQQRVLLGRSDVSGWGAFLKNSVGKHEYLGEYTGELISHREADKRGKIYDRENSSFLFNLNDQFVLDAYRKGDKLKFANHSPDPNCYAKVIMVAGDHRVGIFAKERISAGEELFYDYRYEPDRAPAWARKPEAGGSRKEDTGPSSGRAKKLA